MRSVVLALLMGSGLLLSSSSAWAAFNRDGVSLSRYKPGETFRDCGECPEMVVIPSGSFRMGDLNGGGDRDENPVHRVAIPRPFAVGKHEVTRRQFRRFVDDTAYATGNACWTNAGGKWKKRDGRNWKSPGFGQSDSHPVVCVNWNDAKAYVAWLRRKTGKPYRLLSETEWEYTARARTETKYPWGNRVRHEHANYGPEKSRGGQTEGRKLWEFTGPVGSFSSNAFGLHDMHGNVWEWVEDCWNGSYDGAPADGRARTSGHCSRRVLRGGSWYSYPGGLRAANRSSRTAGIRNNGVGFRVARTLGEPLARTYPLKLYQSWPSSIITCSAPRP